MADPAGAETGGDVGAAPGPHLYRLLVENVLDYAIFLLDPEGRVRSWNEGAERIKGYAAGEIVGSHISAFYTEEDRERGLPEHGLRVAAEEGRFEGEGWRVRKDGTRFWANVVVTALRGDDGRLIGFAKITRDLTERHAAAERAVEDARRVSEAEAVSRAKSEFLAAMSHELRTPLNAIGGYVELLELGLRGPVTEAQRHDLERIRVSQRHLLSLINDILNYVRLEGGQVPYRAEAVPLPAVVEAVVETVAARLEAAGLSLECGPLPASAVALADRPKVEQIVFNLLSNAAQFTPAGGRVTLSCAVAGDTVALTVVDTGSGIEPGELESIFEPFVQLGRTLTTGHGGTGLGLAISRELARAMGGDLTVESAVGEGSAFTLTLPRI